MPKDWRTFQLSELMTFRNGLNYTGSDAGEAIKIVGVADFQARDVLNDTAALQVVRVKGRVSDTDLLKSGDLLFVRSNGNKALIGRCLYFPAVTERLAFSGFTIKGRVDPTKLAPDFAAYLLRAPHVTAQMQLGGAGTNISNLSQEILNRVQIKVPALEEQSHITKFIKVWDLAISAAERLLANTRRQKDALSLVFAWGGRRSNGRSGKVIRLHASDLFAPVSIRRNENAELLSVTQEQGVIPRRLLDRRVVMPEGATDSYKLVEPGDFVISLRSFEGGLEYSRYRGIVSPAYTVLRAKKPICDDFYRHYFKSKDFISRLSVAVIGIRDGKQISYDDFAFLKIPSPPIEVQRKVADVLNDAEHEIALLANHLEALKAEKHALMADLLTGKRRVRMPDTTAEPEAA